MSNSVDVQVQQWDNSVLVQEERELSNSVAASLKRHVGMSPVGEERSVGAPLENYDGRYYRPLEMVVRRPDRYIQEMLEIQD